MKMTFWGPKHTWKGNIKIDLKLACCYGLDLAVLGQSTMAV